MVRTIMGTLFEINENKIQIDSLEEIINKKDRKQAGPSVPAHRLYLQLIKKLKIKISQN